MRRDVSTVMRFFFVCFLIMNTSASSLICQGIKLKVVFVSDVNENSIFKACVALILHLKLDKKVWEQWLMKVLFQLFF